MNPREALRDVADELRSTFVNGAPFWKGEMTGKMADDGKDPRGGPDFSPLWNALGLTPGGRGKGWIPKLYY